MLKTIKKIVLFLFGIVLVVFGNKAAINTIFKDKDAAENNPPASTGSEVKESVITEEVQPIIEPKIVNTPTSVEVPKVAEKKERKATETEQARKQETKSTVAPATVIDEKAEPQPAKTETEIVKETPKTSVEPEKSESASGTE